jgi:hypothetical protein
MSEPVRPHASTDDLVARLVVVSDAIIDLVAGTDPGTWDRSPGPGVWSAGKESEHVAEALPLHLWFVRRSLRQRAGTRPTIERDTLTTDRSPLEVAERIRQERDTAIAVIAPLTDPELELPSNPPRGRDDRVAELIERIVIGHLETHHAALTRRLRRRSET